MKIDFKKTLPSYEAPKDKFEIIEVPKLKYLMIDGYGAPTSDNFAKSIQALYPIAYKIKFASKIDLGKDYVVPPLEGLWWAEDMSSFTTNFDKSKWSWTLMLMTPDWITHKMFADIVEKIKTSKKVPEFIDQVRLESYSEGLSVQILHLGSFDNEGPVLAKLHHEFVPEHNLVMTGHHHEIYLSDFRKTAPEKLRTIMRQPVANQAL